MLNFKIMEVEMKKLDNFLSKKVIIALIILVFTLAGIVYTYCFVTPLYSSSTTFILTNYTAEDKETESKENSELKLNSELSSAYVEIIKSKKILKTVITNLKIDIDEKELRKNLTVNLTDDSSFVEIRVTNKDPELAAKIANETAKVFTQNVEKTYKLNKVHIIDEAEVELIPQNINHIRDIFVFAMIGVAVLVILVIMLNIFDKTIKSSKSIEKLVDLPVLASIPKYDFTEVYEEVGGNK